MPAREGEVFLLGTAMGLSPSSFEADGQLRAAQGVAREDDGVANARQMSGGLYQSHPAFASDPCRAGPTPGPPGHRTSPWSIVVSPTRG